MTPTEFPEHNVKIAEHQDEYQTLPAFVNGQETISCWRFTLWERLLILIGRPLWLRQLNFSQPLQPQLPTLQRPFVDVRDADTGYTYGVPESSPKEMEG